MINYRFVQVLLFTTWFFFLFWVSNFKLHIHLALSSTIIPFCIQMIIYSLFGSSNATLEHVLSIYFYISFSLNWKNYTFCIYRTGVWEIPVQQQRSRYKMLRIMINEDVRPYEMNYYLTLSLFSSFLVLFCFNNLDFFYSIIFI